MVKSRLIIKEIVELEYQSNILKRLRHIRNELLSNGAYHNKNLEIQIKKLESANASNNEIQLVTKSNELSGKISHDLMNKYNILLDKIEKEYNFRKG